MKKIVGVVIGAIIALAGIAAMFKPIQTYLQVGWLVGALLLIHGIEQLYRLLVEQNKNAKKKIFRILEIVVGMMILGSMGLRILTDVMFAYLASVLVILGGIYFIINGIRQAERKSGKILRGAIGLIIVGLGVVLLYEPVGTITCIVYAVATALALQGIDIIMISLFGRKEAFKEE